VRKKGSVPGESGHVRVCFEHNIEDFLFLLLHRACCRVTQLLHRQLHIYKIYKFYICAVVDVIIE